MKIKVLLLAMTVTCVAAQAQKKQHIIDYFDDNSYGWTECAYKNDIGTAIIDKGVMTITSNEKKDYITSFETHCYAPIQVAKPFTVIADVTIGKLDDSKLCGFVFNYRDNGNYYAFAFNETFVRFVRWEDNRLVGEITQGVKWSKKRKLNQTWKLTSEDGILTFFVDDMEILKVKYMPLDYSGIGFYTVGQQKLVVDQIEFVQ